MDIHILHNDDFSFDDKLSMGLIMVNLYFVYGVSLVGVDGFWGSVWLDMAAGNGFVLVAWFSLILTGDWQGGRTRGQICHFGFTANSFELFMENIILFFLIEKILFC